MSKVAKHYSKEEREGNNDRHGRVYLLIGGCTIRIDNGLEAFGKLIGLQISRWLLVGSDFLNNGWSGGVKSVGDVLKSKPDERQIISGASAFSDKDLAGRIERE